MRRRHSLRFRVALAFAALGAALSLLFALGIWYATHDVSRRLMDETLEAELSDYMARRARNPDSQPPATTSLTGYLIRPEAIPPGLPAEVAQLPPGRHEIVIAGTPHRVAVAARGGERYLLLFDETRQQLREERFLVWLIAGAALMTLLATIGGLWLAGRVIAPVTELARAVSGADPADPPRLADAGDPGDEIDELARAFDRYLARLAAFVERERSFAADASHELRTPLTAIRGAAEVLADDPALAPAQATRVARITRAAEEMGELITTLLMLAREESTPAETSCDAARIVTDSVERHRAQAAARNIRIDLEIGAVPELAAPPAFLAIVAANLIHNAIAHTRDGHVRIALGDGELVVADSGQGIPPGDIARVFERHYRGAESAGAGIGLALVRRICERTGWQVALESDPARGTTARVRFPAA
ncbi:MAG: HAMP domain-containing sensor histidine kinase [Pseudomonadota bacterium]